MKGVVRLLSIALVAAVIGFATAASAQNTTQNTAEVDEPVEAKGVGISGGIIAGAEVVLILEAVIDVEPVWPWIVFPILGAGGGGVGGYFLEQNSPKGAVALLVSSMALLIPTAVAVSLARAYEPESEGAVEDTGGMGGGFSFSTGGGAEEGTVTEVESRPEGIPEGATAPAPGEDIPEEEPVEPAPEEMPGPSASRQQDNLHHLKSGSLFHVGRNFSAGFGIPNVDVRPTSLSADESLMGVERGLEVRIPILRVDLP